ncbi:hypothetical protein JTB14_025797 [Gonioctena quinquepunctata]|nr:hypothetical protein JTB14_025797 [Gonioctena quinquepunctata]
MERRLINDQEIKRDSRLIDLNPFLDPNGLKRVGRRVNNAQFDFEKKHVVILHEKSHLALLIVEHTHHKLLHSGPQHTLAVIREEYWIMNGRSMIRSLILKCIVCFCFRITKVKSIITALPESRLNPKHPFEITGVDYAGPFLMKSRSEQGCKISKAYISIFICFVTEAVHLDLSEDAFLLSLKDSYHEENYQLS